MRLLGRRSRAPRSATCLKRQSIKKCDWRSVFCGYSSWTRISRSFFVNKCAANHMYLRWRDEYWLLGSPDSLHMLCIASATSSKCSAKLIWFTSAHRASLQPYDTNYRSLDSKSIFGDECMCEWRRRLRVTSVSTIGIVDAPWVLACDFGRNGYYITATEGW